MMERRQIWLEDQFLQQERDLLRLKRQINVLQDFITLHFDSFRDYSFERERADRRVDEVSLKSKSFLRSPSRSPYGQYPSKRSRDLDDPVDLSEYPEECDLQPSSPLDAAVDLSTNWRTRFYSQQEEAVVSPPPVLSRSTISLPKEFTNVSDTQQLLKTELTEVEEAPSTANDSPRMSPTLLTYGIPSSSSCANSLQLNPYDSVLSRILRSEPSSSSVDLKCNLNSMVSTTGGSVAEGSKLHWSCGTVTTTCTKSTDGHGLVQTFDHDLPEQLSDDNIRADNGDDLYSFTSSLRIDLSTDAIAFQESPISKLSPEKGSRRSKPKSAKSSSNKLPKKCKKTKCSSRTTETPSSSNTVESSSPSPGQGSKKCRFCGKTFQWSHSVKTHERLHTGDKPYLCKMCGTRFTQNGNLKVHAKTCVGKYAELYKSKNIFVCPLCTEMFQTMDSLMEHQRSHDRMQWTDKDKTCRICGQVFQKRSLLLTHEMVHVQRDENFFEEHPSVSLPEDPDDSDTPN